MKSLGYTVGRCIYCGKRVKMIACVRHCKLPAKDPGVPRWKAT